MQPKHQIFNGINKDDLILLQSQLGMQRKTVPRGAVLLLQGQENQYISILESGTAHAVRYTAEGREVDYTILKDGALFGDALALSLGHCSPVSIYTDTVCIVLSFPYRLLLESDLPCAKIVLANLAEELSEKFFSLQQRIHYLTRPTIREKLLAYFFDCSTKAQSSSFTIPLSRNALASFLYCDRSALCRELSNMKREGIIEYQKNTFRLIEPFGQFVKND